MLPLRTTQEMTTIAQNRIDADLFPELDTQEKKDAYVQQVVNEEARRYLRETDWYVTRNVEVGTAIPQEISDDRATARTMVVE